MTYPPNGPDQQPSSGPFGASGDPGQYLPSQYPPGQYPPGQYPGFTGAPAGGVAPQGFPQTSCTWHGDRPTAVSCSRCGRPACPECLTPASVGQHCRACVAEARATQRVPMTVSGARQGVPPLIASVLIGVNVLVYIVTAVNAGSFNEPQGGRIFFELAMIPGNVGAGNWWAVLTAGFLHFGLIHLVVNMMSLYFIGPTLEQVLGRVRFLLVYLLSLLGGSAAVMALGSASDFNAGASGAVFGILGALVVTFKRLRLNMTQLVSVVAVNLIITFTIPQISWQAHLGGLVVGAAVGAAMVYPRPPIRSKVQVATSVAVLVVLAAVIFVRAGSITPSPSCDYLEDGRQGPGVYCLSTD